MAHLNVLDVRWDNGDLTIHARGTLTDRAGLPWDIEVTSPDSVAGKYQAEYLFDGLERHVTEAMTALARQRFGVPREPEPGQ